jgi:hypothetical protein
MKLSLTYSNGQKNRNGVLTMEGFQSVQSCNRIMHTCSMLGTTRSMSMRCNINGLRRGCHHMPPRAPHTRNSRRRMHSHVTYAVLDDVETLRGMAKKLGNALTNPSSTGGDAETDVVVIGSGIGGTTLFCNVKCHYIFFGRVRYIVSHWQITLRPVISGECRCTSQHSLGALPQRYTYR